MELYSTNKNRIVIREQNAYIIGWQVNDYRTSYMVGISEWTVNPHIAAIFPSFGAASRMIVDLRMFDPNSFGVGVKLDVLPLYGAILRARREISKK